MPKSLSDAVEQQAKGLFGTLPETLTLKCRWQYLYGKIQAIQRSERDVPERIMQKFAAIEDDLEEAGINISSLRHLDR